MQLMPLGNVDAMKRHPPYDTGVSSAISTSRGDRIGAGKTCRTAAAVAVGQGRAAGVVGKPFMMTVAGHTVMDR